MQILNQPTEPTTKTIEPFSDMPAKVNAFFEKEINSCIRQIKLDIEKGPSDRECFDAYGDQIIFPTSDELAYWLYNKDVPIPLLPKCVSSRIHAPSRGWRNGGKGKVPPTIDGGWMKEKS